ARAVRTGRARPGLQGDLPPADRGTRAQQRGGPARAGGRAGLPRRGRLGGGRIGGARAAAPRAAARGEPVLPTGPRLGARRSRRRRGAEDVFVGAHLFHNELAHATETTDRAGIRLRDRAGGAVAATFGDYDNDGRPDLYVATASGGALFRNAGDSTFTDVTAAAGLGGAPPATAALFVDLDHDGDVDLFLATPSGNRVYRNVLGGRFEEMAGPMGLGGGAGGTRDAAFGDLDGDGLVD